MPAKALIDALNKQLQSSTENKVKIKQELAHSTLDIIKNDILSAAAKHNLALTPLTTQNNEENENVMSIQLRPNIIPQPTPNSTVTPELENNLAQLPTLKLNFIGQAKDKLNEEEANLLENDNKNWLENSFATFKKELDKQNITTNTFATNIQYGKLPINSPNTLYRTEFIEKMFNKFLDLNPSLAPQAAEKNITNNSLNKQAGIPQEESKSAQESDTPSFNPSPFSTKLRPRNM